MTDLEHNVRPFIQRPYECGPQRAETKDVQNPKQLIVVPVGDVRSPVRAGGVALEVIYRTSSVIRRLQRKRTQLEIPLAH